MAHCSCCGRQGEVNAQNEGYSECCNDRYCHDGSSPDLFGDENVAASACCWGMADRVFAKHGIEIPEDSYNVRRSARVLR